MVIILVLSLVSLGTLFGCVERNLHDSESDQVDIDSKERVYGASSRSLIDLSIDYECPGIQTLFLIFTEYPYDIRPDGTVTEKENLAPAFSGYTDDNGTFTGLFELSSYIDKIYLCTPTAVLPACVELEVNHKKINFKRTHGEIGNNMSPKQYQNINVNFKKAGSIYLVDAAQKIYSLSRWDNRNYGRSVKAQYVTVDKTLAAYANSVQKQLWKGCNTKPYGVDNSSLVVDEKYINASIAQGIMKDGSFETVDSVAINLAFLSDNGPFQNVLGYYYYPTHKTPANADDVIKYIIFPNASTSESTPYMGNPFHANNAPVNVGSRVTLAFIDEAGKEHKRFPAGYTIGWFIVADGYVIQQHGRDEFDIDLSKAFMYSNASFNGGREHVIALNDRVTGRVVVGFEDGFDQSFEDVLFFVESDPAGILNDLEKPDIFENI